MRKIKIYGLLTCVCLMMQSCLFNEDDIFDESSAQRAIASVNECQEILKGAAMGGYSSIIQEKTENMVASMFWHDLMAIM